MFYYVRVSWCISVAWQKGITSVIKTVDGNEMAAYDESQGIMLMVGFEFVLVEYGIENMLPLAQMLYSFDVCTSS